MSVMLPLKHVPSGALCLAMMAFPAAAQTPMNSTHGQPGMAMPPASPQDGMEGMDEMQAEPAPKKKMAPAPGGTMKMGEKPAPATSNPGETMGAMPSGQGMEMAPGTTHGAGEVEEAQHVASADGSRFLWAFLILNAGIIAAAAFLKSRR